MSYSILYRSMFVKMSDGRFIPMMEMGHNNVWECNYGRGRNRRARSWSNIRLNKKQKFFTEEEIGRLHDSLCNILMEALSEPDKPIYRLNVLTDEEREKVLYTFNHTERYLENRSDLIF